MRVVWWVLLGALAVLVLAVLLARPPDGDGSAAVCSIVKHEGPYIDEWIRYHLKLGFDAIWVYDNSDDNELASLPEAYPGRVTVVHFPGVAKEPGAYPAEVQLAAYNHFIARARGVHTWAAFIDLDEFIVLKKHADVKQMLRAHCPHGALCLNWVMFGSSGRERFEPDPVLLRFRRRAAGVDRHVKSVVRLRDVVAMDQPHFPTLVPGARQRDTDGRAFTGPFNPDGPGDVAVVHHYYCKSREEFERRGRPGIRFSHAHNDVFDDSAWAFARPVTA